MELKDRIVDLVNTRLLESYDKMKEWDRSTVTLLIVVFPLLSYLIYLWQLKLCGHIFRYVIGI